MQNIAKMVLTILLLLPPNTAYADRIFDCEQALDAAHEAINAQANTIDLLDAQNRRLQQSLDMSLAEQAKDSAWYRDPMFTGSIAFVLGVTVGAFAIRGR